MSKIIGIDLGTTNSAVAVLEGEMDFASWVAYCHRSRAVKNLLDLMEETSK